MTKSFGNLVYSTRSFLTYGRCRSHFLVDACVAPACYSLPLGEPCGSGDLGIKRGGVVIMPLAPCSVIPRAVRFKCVEAQRCYIAIVFLSA